MTDKVPNPFADESEQEYDNIMEGFSGTEETTPKQQKIEYPKDATFISPSLVSEFLTKGDYCDEDGSLYYCPRAVKECSIDKNFDRKATLSMLNGMFFETGCIGSGRAGEKTLDLPRKKVSERTKREARVNNQPEPEGEKKIDQIRIEEQIIVFKSAMRAHKLRLDNVQEEIIIKWDKYNEEFPNVYLMGHLDIHNTPFLYNEVLINNADIDIKLTKDMTSEHYPYCWGKPEWMDHIQVVFYNILTGNRQFYWVFDYKSKDPGPEWKIIEVECSPDKTAEAHESIRKTCERIRFHTVEGWEPNPVYDRCKNCNVNSINGGSCESGINTQTV